MLARGRPRATVPECELKRLEEVGEMQQRPKALGSTLLVTLLTTFHVASSADAASVGRLCRTACRGEIAACVAAGGRSRPCRKRTLGRCEREGLAVCQGEASAEGHRQADVLHGHRHRTTTTTTTIPLPPTTTTTTRPPTTTTTASTTTITRPPTTTSTTIRSTTTTTL